MKRDHIPYRQIHLDFHTNETIGDVGSRFNADEFVQTLIDAHVNSINLFTKCHHGMYYYPSSVGTMHPALHGFDLFGAQIKACREAGIRVIAYSCVAWNEDWAKRHPEWLMINYDGIGGDKLPFEEGFTKWNTLCYNNAQYKEVMKREFKETWEKYHPDGFWIDIIQGHQCVCPQCRREMVERGMDPTDRNQVICYDRITETRFCKEFFEFLKDLDPDLDIYFNSMPYSLDNGLDEETSSVTKRKYFSFQDIESLPSEDWGYNHFPIAASYINKYDQELAMMNGKFHFSWGDFGSLRNEAALEYECFRALSYGAKVCVGDQLHPTGRLDPVVYRRIGKVFEQIERKEPWLHGTRPAAEIGVFIASDNSRNPAEPSLIEEGAYRALIETHYTFQFLNSLDDLSPYALLILPDHFVPDKNLAARIDAYVAGGGKLLLTGDAGVDKGTGEYVLSCIRAKYVKQSDYKMRYLRLACPDFEAIPQIDHILYERGCVLEAGEGEMCAAQIVDPYFDRTWQHFCSHRQTPPKTESDGEPGILFGAGYAIVSSPLFTDYILNGYIAHRDIVSACIRHLLPAPMIRTDFPSVSEMTVRTGEDFTVLHILNYVCQKRSKRLEIIEEKYTVPDGKICLRADKAPERVFLAPEERDVPFCYADGYVTITPGPVCGHTMIVVQ